MSYYFNGSGGLILGGEGTGNDRSPVNLLVSYPFTLSCWFYPTSTAANKRTLVMVANSTDSYWMNWDAINGPAQPLQAISYNGTSQATVTGSLGTPYDVTPNAWNYAAARFVSDSSRSIIRRATTISTNTTTLTSTSRVITNVGIGIGSANNIAGSNGFVGYIAHVAIWDSSLTTTAEMPSLTYGMSPLAVRRQNLVAYWPMITPGPIVNIADAKSRGRTVIYNTANVRYSNWNPPVKTVRPQQRKTVLESPAAQNNAPIFYHQRQQQGMAA